MEEQGTNTSSVSCRSGPSRSAERPPRLTRNTVERKTMPTRTSKRNAEELLMKKGSKFSEKRTRASTSKEKESTPAPPKRGLLSRFSLRGRKDKDAIGTGEKRKSKDGNEERMDSATENTPPKKKALKSRKIGPTIEDKAKKWDKVAKKNMPSFLKSRSQKMFEDRTKKYCLTDDKGVTVEEPPEIVQPSLETLKRPTPLSAAIWGTGSEVMKPDRMKLPEPLSRPPPISVRGTRARNLSLSASMQHEELGKNSHDDSSDYASMLTPCTSKGPIGIRSSASCQSDATFISIDVSGVLAEVESAVQAAKKNKPRLESIGSGSSSSSTDTLTCGFDKGALPSSLHLATTVSAASSTTSSPTPTSELPVVKAELQEEILSAPPPAAALPCPAFTPHPNRDNEKGPLRPPSVENSSQSIPPISFNLIEGAMPRSDEQRVIKTETLNQRNQRNIAHQPEETASQERSANDDTQPIQGGEEPDHNEYRELWDLVQEQYEMQKQVHAHHLRMEQLAQVITEERDKKAACQRRLEEIEARKRQIMRQKTPPDFPSIAPSFI